MKDTTRNLIQRLPSGVRGRVLEHLPLEDYFSALQAFGGFLSDVRLLLEKELELVRKESSIELAASLIRTRVSDILAATTSA